MTTVPLDALLRRASRMAEQMFDRVGEVDMFWLVENSTREQRVLVTPNVVPPGVSAAEAKIRLADLLRDAFREHEIVRYAHAAEAWMAEDKTLKGPVEEHPRRKEIVILTADDGIEFLSASRDIIRPLQAKPYLGKLSTIERTEQPTGRLTNLINDVRPSSELPDDEGTVFVTNVPGAPFQVLGRRGPTGELFAGNVFKPSPDKSIEQMCRQCSTCTGLKAEIVTGPEAERLIAGVKRKMGGMSPATAH